MRPRWSTAPVTSSSSLPASNSGLQMLTSKLDPGLLADDGAVDVPGHADVRPGVFLLPGVVDH